MSNSVRVAAIQHRSKLGRIDENISTVEPLIEAAAREGSELVALPEMSISGYTLNNEMWRYSEPVDGSTERWLKKISQKHGIWCCVGLTQNIGLDFYNTYLVSNPRGEVVGRVQKKQTEFNIHKAGSLESHVVETSFGRIGIGICADTHMSFFPQYMREQEIALLLLPHAWPTIYKTSKLATQNDINEQEQRVKEYASFYARMLGVPCVFTDQTGPIEGKKWPGITGRLMDINNMHYPGLTTIARPENVICQMGDEEGYIVTDVPLEKSGGSEIPNYNGLVHPGSAVFRFIAYRIDVPLSKLRYKYSIGERKKLLQG